jgi:hypothetical protein
MSTKEYSELNAWCDGFVGEPKSNDAVAGMKPAPQGFHTEPVCNCHDCTQARSLLGKAWLIEQFEALREHIAGHWPTKLFAELASIEQFTTQTKDTLARVEQSQATLAGEANCSSEWFQTRTLLDLTNKRLKAIERAVAITDTKRSSSRKVRGDRGRKR